MTEGFLWCATARQLQVSGDATYTNASSLEASRTASSCFMKLLAEKIQLETTGSRSWEWRRIAFTSKGAINQTVLPFTRYTSFEAGIDPPRQRVNRSVQGLTQAELNFIYTFVFRGVRNTDWYFPITAKTDTLNVKIWYDKTVKINSGNQSGVMRTYTRKHWMNHNLKYLDTEQGEGEASQNFSTTSKMGMGDYYILDLIRGNGGSGDGNLIIAPESTLYWHEK